jgi:uncharacterized protein
MILATGLTLAGVIALERAGHYALLRGLRAERITHQSAPQQFGLEAAAVSVPTARGKALFGWYIPALSPQAPAIVVMHGWGANAAMMLPLAPTLHAAGWAVLLLDARCHGRSDDEAFTSMPRFAEDIEAGLVWLRQAAGGPHGALAVLGHSVGGAAALLCATRNPDLCAVVSVSAFAHPHEVMRRFLAEKHVPYPLLGWLAMQHVQRVIEHRFDDIAPINTLPRLRCPVLIVHGMDDSTVPADDARRLHAARSHERVKLLLMPGAHDLSESLEHHAGDVVRFLMESAGVAAAPCQDRIEYE